MYKIGDTIVYPMHGAGVIEGIEEREILGEVQKYYVLKMPLGDMHVMIPMNNMDSVGIRNVIASQEADRVLHEFATLEIDSNTNWNKRYRENMEKIKSGNIDEVSGVVKSLMLRDREKGLSTGERKMLSNAKQILISEIVLAKGVEHDTVENELAQMVDAQIEGCASNQ